MLVEHGDWLPLGNADEQKPAADGTVEAWGARRTTRSAGWYGLKKGLRGRFGNYVPPVLEALGLAEVEHEPGTTGCAPSDSSGLDPVSRRELRWEGPDRRQRFGRLGAVRTPRQSRHQDARRSMSSSIPTWVKV